MSVEQEVTVEVLTVAVGDDYRIELTATDPVTRATATVSLLWGQAQDHVDEVLAALAEANEKLTEDRASIVAHGFDRDVPPQPIVCRDCQEGKHGACNGSALSLTEDDDVDEVDCDAAVFQRVSLAEAKLRQEGLL